MTGPSRRAQLLLLVGAVLLAIAAALVSWDLAGGDGSDGPVPVTGNADTAG